MAMALDLADPSMEGLRSSPGSLGHTLRTTGSLGWGSRSEKNCDNRELLLVCTLSHYFTLFSDSQHKLEEKIIITLEYVTKFKQVLRFFF